jgi:glycosyltransferase involved in cell wall biosynthesis
MEKPLTIWIPTYRRPEYLSRLIKNISTYGLLDFAEVIVSNNDPLDHSTIQSVIQLHSRNREVTYRSNPSNMTAGVNFLKAFEYVQTPWLMIVGDDDLFTPNSLEIISSLMETLSKDIVAVKFDSSLFGAQQGLKAVRLQDYVEQLRRADYPDAFNNLCLISNWLFQTEPCLRYISTAFLGYSSKISHLFPLLTACRTERLLIQFMSAQPVIHGTCEEATWPKAATWFEMVMTLSSFSGFVDKQDRQTLLRLILHSDWPRYITKCFRIHHFYSDPCHGISPWNIHLQLCLLSSFYRIAFLFSFPFLLIPARWLPRAFTKQLGDPGRVDRW